MKISGLFVVLLISINMFSCLKKSKFESVMTPNKSIRGKLTTMLIQIQNDDQSPTSLKDFMDELREMLNKLQSDQATHEATHDKMVAQCLEEQQFRAGEISAATDALSRSNEALNKCQVNLDESNKELPDLKKTLDTYTQELERATNERNSQHDQYVARRDALQQAIDFLSDFVQYCKDKFSGKYAAFSFAQLQLNVLNHASKLRRLEHAVPVLIALATAEESKGGYTSVANQNLADKLKGALDKLQSVIQGDFDKNESIENAAASAFAEYSAKLSTLINQLTTSIAETEQHIKDMVKCIADEEVIISTANSKLNRNTILADSASNMCDSFNKEFVEATLNRLEEIQTMEEIIEIVKKRFGHIADDLEIYLQNTKAGWLEYVNSTKFKAFQEYQQNLGTDNESGAALEKKDASTETNQTFGSGKF